VYQNPALLEAVARDRVVDLLQNAELRANSERETRRRRVAAAARNGTGWLLVDIGLRLAMPRTAMDRPMPRGRR
jgi:hypothetical protein